MLPVVMDIARTAQIPPSRLLMPLAYGSLLGGLTTQIGTPPNILVTDALRDAGLPTFSFFDFTPLGLTVMAAGIAFMALIGRHLLPKRDVIKDTTAEKRRDWKSQYGIGERLFVIRVPEDSALIGKTLAESRIGSALGLNVLGITRRDRSLLAPGPSHQLVAGDRLTVEGRVENLLGLQKWGRMTAEKEAIDMEAVYSDTVRMAEVSIPPDSRLAGQTLNALNFRSRYGANVLALKRGEELRRTGLADVVLQRGDRLLIAGDRQQLGKLQADADVDGFRTITTADMGAGYRLHRKLMALRVPVDSVLIGKTLKESRLSEALGSRVLGILRGDAPVSMPEPGEILQAGDRLVMEGRQSDFDILEGLAGLVIERRTPPGIETLVSEEVGLVEVILSPHTTLAGTTLRQLNFREKYGLNVLAVWRGGRVYRSDLRDMALRFGDALLLFGSHGKLQVLGQEPDFIVLTETAQERPRLEKAKVAMAIMAAVLLPVILDWTPIYIAAVVGAAFMVLSGCLTMDEAYRQIEWKAVFLIAGMLPLGAALDQTGAARLIAEGVVSVAGPYGPAAVLLGLTSLTFLATCFVPTAALVVLMAPIALNTSAGMGLSTQSLMMAVAMAASASFTTPIAHPANILVMGPGGYRFSDYLKVGGLLTLVTLAVLMVFLPIFWPLK
jgi:di/tricarboxylate transporter